MANNIEITLNLNDNGSIKSKTKDAAALNTELEKSQAIARKMRPIARAGQDSGAEGEEYGRARGTVGTGAAGRDFAKQAQGLGGLVHIYATFAANLFAVGAAFRALSEAMNTDIMIRGLDKLGAASGVAMGGLAKQFAQASDGAISLRESMEATAKAISSGMSAQQFMQLSTVAKGASQTLGVGMSDAVSRLTRGITKLEPELLDELGIFTKVGKAAEDYAKSVNKSVDSITDFEKRQAFANAVIAEGIQKFGEAAGQANPYDKLLANFKNVAQEILSAVNSIVAPIAKILAENSGLIAGAIALVAAKLLKQAIPALTSWRNGLKNAAATAAQAAGDINTSFGEAFVERFAAKFKLPDIQADIAKAEKLKRVLYTEFEANAAYKRPNQSSIMKAIREGRDLTDKELVTAQREIARYSKSTEESAQKHADILTRIVSNQKNSVGLKKQELDINEKIDDKAQKSIILTEEWQREQIVENKRSKSASLNLINEVSGLVERKGLKDGLGQFYKDTFANKDLGNFGKLKTAAVGTFAGIATASQILLSSLSKFFFYIEVAALTFTALNALLGKNSKEVDAFTSSIANLQEATKTAASVSEKYGNTLTTESINAKANAFRNVAEGVDLTAKNLIKADEAASGMDRMWDNVKVLWGGNLANQFKESLSSSVMEGIDQIPEGELRNALVDRLNAIFGTATLSKDTMSKAIDSLTKEGKKALGTKVAAELMGTSKTVMLEIQAISQDVKESSQAVNAAYVTLKNSISDKSPVNAFLDAAFKQAQALEKALKNANTAQVELNKLASGEIKAEFLTADTAKAIMPIAEQTSKLSGEISAYNKGLDVTRTKLQDVEKQIEKVQKRAEWDADSSAALALLEAERDTLSSIINMSVNGISQANAKIKELAENAAMLIKKSLSDQIDIALNQASLRIAQIRNQQTQSMVAALPIQTEASIKYQASLQQEALRIETQLFKSQESLVRSIDLLTIQVQRDADERELARVTEQLKQQELEQRQGKIQRPNQQLVERSSTLIGRINRADTITRAYTARDLNTLKDIAKSDPALVRGLISSVSGMSEFAAAQAAKAATIQFNESSRIISLRAADEQKRLDAEIAKRESEKQTRRGTGSEAMESTRLIDEDIARLREQKRAVELKEKVDITNLIDRALKDGVVAKATIEKLQADFARESGTQAAAATASRENYDFDIRIRKQEELNALNAANREGELANFRLLAQEDKQAIEFAKARITQQKETGAISEDEAQSQLYSLSLLDAQLERTVKIREANAAREAAMEAFELNKLKNNGELNDELRAQQSLYETTYKAAVAGAESAYAAQKKLLDLQNAMSNRQLAYTDLVKGAFKDLEDAIVDFAKTGKLSFSKMIDSFIEGMIRYEMQRQSQRFMESFGGAGGIAKSLVGWLFGPTGDPDGSYSLLESNRLARRAQGGAFDAGIELFAKGGAFTNSIVDSPTLFKFAQGAGLMGEAGPEAIMPLKRDSDGNLGVRASAPQTNVEVVVNNYTSAPATTRETVDSRGNRRIEVVVGEMVANELARNGSQTQQAMLSQYGSKPMVTRR